MADPERFLILDLGILIADQARAGQMACCAFRQSKIQNLKSKIQNPAR
jgi:hypothetical protein